MQAYLVLLHFALLHFTDVVFLQSKALRRQKDDNLLHDKTCFTAAIGNRTCRSSKVCPY